MGMSMLMIMNMAMFVLSVHQLYPFPFEGYFFPR